MSLATYLIIKFHRHDACIAACKHSSVVTGPCKKSHQVITQHCMLADTIFITLDNCLTSSSNYFYCFHAVCPSVSSSSSIIINGKSWQSYLQLISSLSFYFLSLGYEVCLKWCLSISSFIYFSLVSYFNCLPISGFPSHLVSLSLFAHLAFSYLLVLFPAGPLFTVLTIMRYANSFLVLPLHCGQAILANPDYFWHTLYFVTGDLVIVWHTKIQN